MKRLFALLLLSIPFTVTAQYTVGVPVQDTLWNGLYNSISFCEPLEDVSIYPSTDMLPYVTGVDLQLHITNYSGPVGAAYTEEKGTLATGDTLSFSDFPQYTFHFPGGGGIEFLFMAVGTPTVAGEPYYCEFQLQQTLGNCANANMLLPINYPNPTCSVDVAGSIGTASHNNQVWLFPNPTANTIQLRVPTPLMHQNYRIVNALGQQVMQGQLNGLTTAISVSTLPQGMYVFTTPGATQSFIKQ